ncbi:MAG: FliG C-terminal domain-containing protein [Planctomycetaceae bacterium]
MLTEPQQAAELLKLLGDDTAEAVLAHLRPEQADALRGLLGQPAKSSLRPARKAELIDNFERFFQFALKNAPRGPKLFQEDEDSRRTPAKLTGDPLTDLATLSVHQISQALETEQPRTVAILMSQLPPQLSAEVLGLLLSDHRSAVARELARELEAPKLLVERIARATYQRGVTLPADPPDRRDRVDRLSEVMRAVPKKYRREMMTAIEEEDEELSQALMKRLYRFEDLVNLEQRTIQQILGEVDGNTLTTALFKADEDVLEAIMGNLSRRARQTIEEELEFQTQVPEARVIAAREAVAAVIAKVDSETE